MLALPRTVSLFPGPALMRNWPFGDLEPYAFDFIMADPPWHFENYSQKGEAKGARPHYETMSLPDIAALPVAQLAATKFDKETAHAVR